MTVTAYGVGLSPARALALGVTALPSHHPRPVEGVAGVALYSDRLERWRFYPDDDGSLTPARWAADELLVDDTAATNGDTLRSAIAAALTANRTFLGLASPSNAQTLAQVRALTRQVNALARLVAGLLDTTNGT